MSMIVRFSTAIIFVSAIISMNAILLVNIHTHLLYARHDKSDANNLLTVNKLITSFPFIHLTTPLLSTFNETVQTSNQPVQNSSTSITKNATNSTSPLTLQQKPLPPSNNTYTNLTDGISFGIPQGWTTEEGQNQANATLLKVVTVSPPISLDPNGHMRVIIEKDTLPPAKNLRQYMGFALYTYRNIPSNNFRLISSNINNITLSGWPAYSLLFTYTSHNAGPSKQLEVGTLITSQGYLVDYYGSTHLFSKFLPQVRQIINTFEVRPPR